MRQRKEKPRRRASAQGVLAMRLLEDTTAAGRATKDLVLHLLPGLSAALTTFTRDAKRLPAASGWLLRSAAELRQHTFHIEELARRLALDVKSQPNAPLGHDKFFGLPEPLSAGLPADLSHYRFKAQDGNSFKALAADYGPAIWGISKAADHKIQIVFEYFSECGLDAGALTVHKVEYLLSLPDVLGS